MLSDVLCTAWNYNNKREAEAKRDVAEQAVDSQKARRATTTATIAVMAAPPGERAVRRREALHLPIRPHSVLTRVPRFVAPFLHSSFTLSLCLNK